MSDPSLLQIVGIVGVCLLVGGWLVVSLQRPGVAQTRVAWLATTGMYLGFVALFGSLFLRARAGGSTAGMIGFGFLLFFFLVGLVLCCAKTLGSLRRATSGGSHATH